MKVVIFLLFCASALAQASPGFTKLANVTTTAYTDSSCPNLSSCGYQITAVNSVGLESPPFACSLTQLCLGGNIAVVIMPSSGTHTVGLGWVASPTAGVSYNVYRSLGPLAGSSFVATVN